MAINLFVLHVLGAGLPAQWTKPECHAAIAKAHSLRDVVHVRDKEINGRSSIHKLMDKGALTS